LVATELPESSDLEKLHVSLSAYGPVVSSAAEDVARSTDVVPADRIKNTGTILEKLHRQGGYSLATIHDLGGLRVVIDGTRTDQDLIVEKLRATFSTHPGRLRSTLDERRIVSRQPDKAVQSARPRVRQE
jgi:ppGpp synthetase/RelA/SpoT-type nucleotidyltranferase